METAIQQLYELLISSCPKEWVCILIKEEKMLLEKEKEQINEAYFEGNEDGYNQEEDYDSENLIDYYEKTYKK
jgi:hypothetical protein